MTDFQAPQPGPHPLQPACRYISDVLASDASSGEKHIARTVMHLLPLVPAPAPSSPADADKRFSWMDFQLIGELPAVDEAVRALLDDQTADNATCMIRAVVEAAGDRLAALAVPSPEGGSAADVADRLERYNAWRRGNSGGAAMPDPREIGEAIDVAVAMLRAALAAQPAAFDVERMIRECLPGGQSCDPQAVADSIRAWAQAAQPQEETWAGAGAFIQHVQVAAGMAGSTGHWPDEFLAWYQPDKWLGEHRAAAVFLGQKLAAQAPAETRSLSARTYMAEGMMAAVVQSLLGHKHAEMTAVYLNDRGLTEAEWKLVDA